METSPEPTKDQVLQVAEYTQAKDAPVIAAAKTANPDFLATYDRKHLIDPPLVAEKSGLRIVTPDAVLAAIREE
jgi:predicted nucleic acid-binding protein